MRTSFRSGIAIAAALATPMFGVSPVSGAPTTPSSIEPIKQAVRLLIRSQMQEHNVPGLSLALVDAERVLWAEGFGFADRERRIKAGPETVYAAGNLTQALTAVLAMQMVERGEIDLDQPLRLQLPEFSIRTRFPGSRPITPRNLLSHHSGLPAMHFRDMWAPQPEPLASFVNRLRDEFTAFPPGLVRVPSFPGYDVIGRLIEVRCGSAFGRCMERHVLKTLDMSKSTFDHRHSRTSGRARHYWSRKPVAFTSMRDVPAAGLMSTALDLGKFSQMVLNRGNHRGKTVLKPSSVAELMRAQNQQVPLDLDYRGGLPWHLTGIHFPQARLVAWLDNESPFARGRILLVPEHNLAVVLLTNSSGSSDVVRKVSERIIRLVLDGRRAARPVSDRPTTEILASTPGSRRNDVVGTYATQLGKISVTARPAGFRATLLGKTLDLEPQSDGMLAPKYRLLGMFPIPLDVLREARLSTAIIAGHQLAIARYRGRTFRFGERVTPVRIGPAWSRRLGDYEVVQRDELLNLVNLRNVSLRLEGDYLMFRYRVPGWLGLVADIPVRPVSDIELVVEGTGWLMGDTISVAHRDNVETLRYSGYEFRRIARRH